MPYPYVRKAKPEDYEAIWSIWMQDHIIQWMSFPKQTKEDFAAHYNRMKKASKIYVVVDEKNNDEKVVGVRRIKFGKNEYQHIAEYCSMGIDKDLQGNGYGKCLYQEFEKIVRRRGIKRIQLTQSGGNEAAFHIAKNFSQEGIFPDWLERSNNDGNYHLIERYIYRFLDENLALVASKIPSLKYDEIFPLMKIEAENKAITVERINNQFIGYLQDKPLLTVDFEPDDSVIQHIGFLSINLHSLDDQPEAGVAFRTILSNILAEGRVKKLELFTADPVVADLCRNTGFFVRGEKIASYCDNGEYKNELGVEYSFFDIADAKKLTLAKVSDPTERSRIDAALSMCSKTIEWLVENNTCDRLSAKYLENLTYQMVRDDLGPNNVFSLADKRWKPLLEQSPTALHNDLLCLYNRLNSPNPGFFKKDKLELLSQVPSPDLKI